MAKKSGLTPLWTKRDIKKIFDKLGDSMDVVVLDILQRTGEEFVKVARLDGQYIDHTGNLRSSIGYIILRNGEVISKNFKLSNKEGTDKYTGMREAEQLAMELTSLYSKGYVLIGVAGMKYAAYVEAMENKDVISLAADKAEDFIRSQSRLLFNALKID